jgi:hypothetical protein
MGRLGWVFFGTVLYSGLGAAAGAIAGGRGRRGKGAAIGAGIVGGTQLASGLVIVAMTEPQLGPGPQADQLRK